MRCHHVQSPALNWSADQGLPHVVNRDVCCDVGQADCCDSHVFESVGHSAALVSGHDEVVVYEVVNKRGVKYDREVVVESEVVCEDVEEESEAVCEAALSTRRPKSLAWWPNRPALYLL
jgi:hypothetical protein